MKVYIIRVLCCEEYGDYDVYGVYSTMEKAKAVMSGLNVHKVSAWFDEEGLDSYYIEEYEVQ